MDNELAILNCWGDEIALSELSPMRCGGSEETSLSLMRPLELQLPNATAHEL